MTDLSPAQKAVDAFNERYELCGPFDDDWVEQCLAAALEAVADQVAPGPWRVNSCCDQREHSVRGGILAIAAELRGTTPHGDTMTTDWKALCAELAKELAEEYGVQREFDGGDPLLGSGAIELLSRVRTALDQPEPEGVTLGYIDAEHTGRDREMLEAFYKACRSEGGTADEIHLRGLKAVLARCGRPAVEPEPEESTDEELLRTYGLAKRDHCYEGPIDDWPKRAERAATVHGLRAIIAADRARWGRPAVELEEV